MNSERNLAKLRKHELSWDIANLGMDNGDKQKKYWLPAKIKKVEPGTPGVTAFELIKRAYESNTLDKLRDFLDIEPQPVTG